METQMTPPLDSLTRRDCLKTLAAGAAATGLGGIGASPLFAMQAQPGAEAPLRQVLVFSDTHIGLSADNVDGGDWLSRALTELRENEIQTDYAMILGDIAHGATEDAYNRFIELRDNSGIDRWFELAGNHEYHGGTCEHYEAIVRSTDPYGFVDGNIAWFFISDEEPGVPGNLSDESYDWLRAGVAANQDKIVIVCSHQLVNETIRTSDNASRYIHPKEKIAELLAESRVDLWMCGHEHHRPYSHEEQLRKDGTTFINVASMSHAYGTRESQSFLLEFAQGSQQIVARRRVHDTQAFTEDYEIVIPLDRAIELGDLSEPGADA